MIYIIDDDADIRDSLVEVLSSLGYAAQAAPHGQAALEAFARSSTLPKLILLDLMTPVMSGEQFRHLQLADPRLAAIPTVVFSAGANLQDKLEPLRLHRYLRKPVDLSRLMELASEFCGA